MPANVQVGGVIAPDRARVVAMLSIPHGCGIALVDIHTRYHVFGLALGETLPARVPLGRNC